MTTLAALTIAGTDCGGGAGAAADLRTFAAFGVWGTVAVTAVTAQDRSGVVAAEVMDPELVRTQIEAVGRAYRVGAVKTGMLGTAKVVAAVAQALVAVGDVPLVIDPVQSASRGGSLIEADAWPVLMGDLLPRCTVLTPNLPEASSLLGRPVDRREEMPEAAAALAALGPAAVLLKGGHLGGPASPDLLWHAGRATWLEGDRVGGAGPAGPSAHGTGCTLSAAIAAQLAVGAPVEEACRRAKAYVTEAVRAASAGFG